MLFMVFVLLVPVQRVWTKKIPSDFSKWYPFRSLNPDSVAFYIRANPWRLFTPRIPRIRLSFPHNSSKVVFCLRRRFCIRLPFMAGTGPGHMPAAPVLSIGAWLGSKAVLIKNNLRTGYFCAYE
jgi:hypothetical protein